MEISTDLYTKLWRSKTIAHTQKDVTDQQQPQTVRLPQDQSNMLMNGYALGHYLLVLRNAMRRNNQDLNVDETAIESLVNSMDIDIKKSNFKKICAELDKVGLSIDEEDQEAMAKGDREKLIAPYTRIERFLTKIAGKKIFEFEDEPQATNQPQKQPTIGKGVERQKSILKNQSSMKGIGINTSNSPSRKQSLKPIISPSPVIQVTDQKQIESPISKKVTQQKTIKQATDKNPKRGVRPNQRKGTGKQTVDIMSMDMNRLPNETDSSLELILNTLCRSCEMKPKQAAALLTNNNQYLIHSVIKGIKGQFNPIQQWYQELYVNSSYLCMLVEQEIEDFPESSNCQKVLSSIGVGFYSTRDNLEICLQCLKVLNKMCDEFSVNQSVIENAFKWFIAKEGGFELCLHSLSNHTIQDIGEDIAQLIAQFVNTAVNPEERFVQIYKDRFLKYYTSPALYLQAINEMLPYILLKNKDEMLKSDILPYWIDIAVRQADNQQNLSVEERIPSLTFLAEVWFQFTTQIDQKGPDLANSFLATLRKCSRDKSIAAKIVAISLMFRLLDKFAIEKNVSAPLIYKSLIFTMVESCHDQTLREHYLSNFTNLFQSVPSIPISLLIEPLLKQMQSDKVPFSFNIFDFDFFKNLSAHPKFNLNMAIQVSDLLTKLFHKDPVSSTFIITTIVQIFSRYLYSEDSTDQPMHHFVMKFIQLTLNGLPELEKSGKKNGNLLLPPKSPNRRHIIGGGISQNDREGPRLIKKAMSIGIIQRILQLRLEDLNEQIRQMLVRQAADYKQKNGTNHKGILSLLAFFSNNPAEMVVPIIKEPKSSLMGKATLNKKLEKKTDKQQQSPSNSSLLAILPDQGSNSQTNSQTALEVYKGPVVPQQPASTLSRKPRSISNYNSLQSRRKQQTQPLTVANSKEGTLALPSSSMDTSHPIDLRFYQNRNQQEMDNIIKKKFDDEEQKKIEEEKKRALSAKKKARMKDMLEKRKAELGVASMRKPLVEGVGISLKPSGDSTKALIHDDGVVEQEFENNKWEKSYKIQITLLDLNLEEMRDQEAIKSVMKKYQKLWRNLFSKYANTIIAQSKGGNFDQIGEKTHQINYAEVTKMLKDHGLLPVFIQKEELYQLFRLINLSLNNKSETKALDYHGYYLLIPQIAFLSFSRPPKDLSAMPLVESLLTLIQIFRETARLKNWALFLYEDPDIGVQPGVDHQLIKALNEKLKKDPSYPIPEGYVKIGEKTPVYQYLIPQDIAAKLSESKVVCVELLDEIINQAFGFHFLEPLISFEEFPKVKPVIINKIKSQPAEAVTLMNKAEGSKKVSLQPDPTSRSQSTLQSSSQLLEENFFKPKLGLGLKLEVSKHPINDRPQVQQVAEVLEEMLLLLHDKNFQIDTTTHLPPRASKIPGQTQNEARRMKEEEMRQKTEMRAKDMEKWKKRKDELKQEIDRLKAQKEQEEKDKQLKDSEAKKKEEKKKKLMDEDAKKRYDDNKKKIEEAKKIKQIEEEEKKNAEEWKAKEEKEKRVKEAKEFFKAQKDRLVTEFEQVAKDRELVQEKKNEIKRKEDEQFLKLKNAMEGYIKDNGKSIKETIKKENQEIETFIQRPDIIEIFDKYDSSLRHLYKFYAAQDKLDWLDHHQENMNLKEFIRFSFQHRIIPVLIEKPDDLVKLFRHAIKAEGEQAVNHLKYEPFKKCLIRISVLAQDQIGGQHEDKLSERMQVMIKEQEDQRQKRDKLLKQANDKVKDQQTKQEELKQEFKAKVADKVIKKVEVHQGKKIYQEVPHEKIYEINENLKAQEDEFFKKWLKIRENKGIGVKKPGSTMEANETPNIRKTKEQRILKELANQEHKVDGLSNIENALDEVKKVKVLDSVKGNFDIQIITPKTVENFLRFLGLVPQVHHNYHLDKNLDKYRIDIQGQRPNKFLKETTKNDLRMMSRGAADENGSTINNARKVSVKKNTTSGESQQLQPGKPSPANIQKTPEQKKPGSIIEKGKDTTKPTSKQEDNHPVPKLDLQKPQTSALPQQESKQPLPHQDTKPELKSQVDQSKPTAASAVAEDHKEHKDEKPQQPKPDDVKPADQAHQEHPSGPTPIKQEAWNNGKPVIQEVPLIPKDQIKPDPIILDQQKPGDEHGKDRIPHQEGAPKHEEPPVVKKSQEGFLKKDETGVSHNEEQHK